MCIDFNINNYNIVNKFIEGVIWHNNSYNLSFKLQYKNPVEFRPQLDFK